MVTHKHLAFILICINCVLFCETQLQAQNRESEIDTIIKSASSDLHKDALFNYSYLMEVSSELPKKFGKDRSFTRLYKVILPSRFSLKYTYTHPLLLIKDSEKSLSQAEITESRKVIVERIERAEREADIVKEENIRKFRRENGGYWTISFAAGNSIDINVLKMLEQSNFSKLDKKKFYGRDVNVIDFAVEPEAKFPNSLSYLSKLKGQIWIDEIDKRIVKIEGFLAEDFEKYRNKPETEQKQQDMIFLFSQTKVKEGYWFPKTVRLNFSGNSRIFSGIKLEFNFREYEQANTGIEGVEIEDSSVEKEKP